MAPPNALKMILENGRIEPVAKLKKRVRRNLPIPAKTACGKIWFMKIVWLMRQPIKKMKRWPSGCIMPGALLNRAVVMEMPVAASTQRIPGGHEVRKMMRTRLRSGVNVAGTPRFGKKLDSTAVRMKAAKVKKSGEKKVRVFIFSLRG